MNTVKRTLRKSNAPLRRRGLALQVYCGPCSTTCSAQQRNQVAVTQLAKDTEILWAVQCVAAGC
eukprot:2769012-Amphidinium_carterae.1